MRALLVLFFSLLALPAFAGSFEVAPTTIDLGANGSGVFYLTNHGASPVTVQVEGYDWTQDEKGDRLALSNSVLFSPPIVKLEPGQQQTVRLMIKPDPYATSERAFRLLVSELPDAATRAQGIRMLLQFSVPVFMAGTNDRPALLAWNASASGSDLLVAAQNNGGKHIKLAKMHLAGASEMEKVAIAPNNFTYILPGASHIWNVPLAAAPRGEALHVQALDEQEGATIRAPLPAIP